MKIQIYILSPPHFSLVPWIPPFRRRVTCDSGEIRAEGIPSCSLVKLWAAPVCLQYPNTEVTESTAVSCSAAEPYFQQGSILGIVKFAERGRYLCCGVEEEGLPEQLLLCLWSHFLAPRWAQIQETSPSCCHVAVMEECLRWVLRWNLDRMGPSWSRAG